MIYIKKTVKKYTHIFIMTIFLFIFIYSIFIFMLGVKNFDLGHNLQLISCETGYDFYDEGFDWMTGKDITMRAADWYLYGTRQIVLGFTISCTVLAILFLEVVWRDKK